MLETVVINLKNVKHSSPQSQHKDMRSYQLAVSDIAILLFFVLSLHFLNTVTPSQVYNLMHKKKNTNTFFNNKIYIYRYLLIEIPISLCMSLYNWVLFVCTLSYF